MATSEQITARPVMTDQDASAVLRAAEARARETGARMVIAVVDGAGDLKAFVRMDGAPRGSIEWTIDKAITAASFGMPTHVLTDGVQSSPPVMASMASLPHITLTPGGYPLMLSETLVGAVAAGGGTTPDQDQVVAEAGVAALGSR
jgi:uncharacterized protein GlcG (DUF336 family)